MEILNHSPVRSIPAALKFVKDAVVFIKGTKFTSKIFMNLCNVYSISLVREVGSYGYKTKNMKVSRSQTHLICFYRPALHVEIPDFDRQVISGHHVAATITKFDI